MSTFASLNPSPTFEEAAIRCAHEQYERTYTPAAGAWLDVAWSTTEELVRFYVEGARDGDHCEVTIPFADFTRIAEAHMRSYARPRSEED